MTLRRLQAALLLTVMMVASSPGARADLAAVATYQLQNTFAADQAGVAALTAVDPLGQNGFTTATLYGQTRQVYHFAGPVGPAMDQGGLSLNTTGLVSTNQYSVEMVFQFYDGENAWRRILDVENRQSDNGFYVDPSNQLDIYPVAGGSSFTNNAFHVVFLTVATDNTVNAYLDGSLAFATNTSVMDINNPSNLMNFFIDNVVGGGLGEYSTGEVGLIQLFNGVVGADQVATMSADPFGGPAVPEPSSLIQLSAGAVGLLALRRRFRRSA